MNASTLDTVRQSFMHIPENDTRSKIGPRSFVIALITAMVDDSPHRSIANLRRQFASSLGQILARSSFWQRLSSKRLTSFLTQSIREIVSKIAVELDVAIDILSILGVKAVYLIDSSSVTLPKDAKGDFPAPRSNVIPAAVKCHFCWNLLSGVGQWCCITDGTTHDRKGFPPINMLKGALIIFDLGYWDYQLLADLMNQGCFFLSRVKKNALIEITGVSDRLEWKAPLGKNLFSMNWNKFRGNIIEMIGTVDLGDMEYAEMRVVGFWNQPAKKYHWYVTNLSIAGNLIYPLYRIRWQIELVFKAGKSSLNFADIPSSNFNIIINLMLASIITNLIAQPLSRMVLERATKEVQSAISVQRAAFVFVHIASELRNYLISGAARAADILIKKLGLFVTELIDPNFKNRPTTLKTLQLLAKN